MKTKKNIIRTILSPCRVSAAGGRGPVYRTGGGLGKFIFFIIAASLFSSCLTVGRIQRNCDKFAQICVTEKETVTVYRDTTIYRTDTVLVELPRDTVKLTDTVRIVNNLAYLPTVHKRFGLIGVDAGVQRSVLKVNAYLTDSTLLYQETDTVFLKGAVKKQTVTNTVPVKYIPGFYKFTFWWFIVQIMVIVFWIVKSFLIPVR